MNNFKRIFFFLLFFGPFIFGCNKKDNFDLSEICRQLDSPCIRGKQKIEMNTSKGKIIFLLDGDYAPVTVGNFLDLVNKGVYENTIFHRVVNKPKPFIAQGGDPKSKNKYIKRNDLGLGNFVDKRIGKVRYIPLEIRLLNEDIPRYGNPIIDTKKISKIKLRHKKGSISMARSESFNSASSQFYISLRNLPILDGRYAVFGDLLQGLDVIGLLEEGDYIYQINHLNKKNK